LETLVLKKEYRCIDYDNKLQISDKFGKMEFINAKKQKQRVGYAIINPSNAHGLQTTDNGNAVPAVDRGQSTVDIKPKKKVSTNKV
jgi:hypothetical protein